MLIVYRFTLCCRLHRKLFVGKGRFFKILFFLFLSNPSFDLRFGKSLLHLSSLLFSTRSRVREFVAVSTMWPRLISHSQGNPLYHNTATGTIISNQSLVLQSVTRSRAGIYTCIGNNQEGDGESNPLNLDIKCEYLLHVRVHIFLAFPVIRYNLHWRYN